MNIPPKWLLAEEITALEQFVKHFGDFSINRRCISGSLKCVEWYTISNGRFRLQGPSLTGLLEEMKELIIVCEPRK